MAWRADLAAEVEADPLVLSLWKGAYHGPCGRTIHIRAPRPTRCMSGDLQERFRRIRRILCRRSTARPKTDARTRLRPRAADYRQGRKAMRARLCAEYSRPAMRGPRRRHSTLSASNTCHAASAICPSFFCHFARTYEGKLGRICRSKTRPRHPVPIAVPDPASRRRGLPTAIARSWGVAASAESMRGRSVAGQAIARRGDGVEVGSFRWWCWERISGAGETVAARVKRTLV